MHSTKPADNGAAPPSPGPTTQVQGLRLLERIGMMVLSPGPRDPYRDLDIFGLMRVRSQGRLKHSPCVFDEDDPYDPAQDEDASALGVSRGKDRTIDQRWL